MQGRTVASAPGGGGARSIAGAACSCKCEGARLLPCGRQATSVIAESSQAGRGQTWGGSESGRRQSCLVCWGHACLATGGTRAAVGRVLGILPWARSGHQRCRGPIERHRGRVWRSGRAVLAPPALWAKRGRTNGFEGVGLPKGRHRRRRGRALWGRFSNQFQPRAVPNRWGRGRNEVGHGCLRAAHATPEAAEAGGDQAVASSGLLAQPRRAAS
jgi:hypothetical protein